VVAGTDQSLGAALHRELELLVEGGIPPLDVIGIATRNGALFLGKERELGTLEEGKLADIVLLDANPAEDIENLKKIRAVIKAGVVIDRSALQIPANGATEP
jgi:imidazolonepropionase-like amidohydrolase